MELRKVDYTEALLEGICYYANTILEVEIPEDGQELIKEDLRIFSEEADPFYENTGELMKLIRNDFHKITNGSFCDFNYGQHFKVPNLSTVNYLYGIKQFRDKLRKTFEDHPRLTEILKVYDVVSQIIEIEDLRTDIIDYVYSFGCHDLCSFYNKFLKVSAYKIATHLNKAYYNTNLTTVAGMFFVKGQLNFNFIVECKDHNYSHSFGYIITDDAYDSIRKIKVDLDKEMDKVFKSREAFLEGEYYYETLERYILKHFPGEKSLVEYVKNRFNEIAEINNEMENVLKYLTGTKDYYKCYRLR